MKIRSQDWLHVIAAVVTVAGGMYLVNVQMNGIVAENRAILTDLTNALQNSSELQTAVEWPLEGRWDYEISFDRYYDMESDPDDRTSQFFSKGIADIQRQGDQYRFLLGYENSTRDGRRLAVSVNSGFCEPPIDGLPEPGTRIEMAYAHRLGDAEVEIGDQTVDFSVVPEGRYHYEIVGYERDDDGRVEVINAHFKVDQSEGRVFFRRLF